jgi:ribosomal protein S27AE
VTDLLLRSEASALLPPGLLQQLQQIRATNQTLSILEGRQGTSRRRKIWTGVRTWKPMLEDPMADIAPAPSLSSRPPAAPGAGLPSPALFYFRFRRASRYPVRSRRACWVRESGQIRSPPPVSGSVSLPWQSWTRAPTWLASRFRPRLNRDRPVPIRRCTRHPGLYIFSTRVVTRGFLVSPQPKQPTKPPAPPPVRLGELTTAIEDAGLREDAEGQDDHAGGGAVGHGGEREGQGAGQGGYPAGPAAARLRGEAVGGRAHAGRLQHPEGVDAAPGPPPPRRRWQEAQEEDVHRAQGSHEHKSVGLAGVLGRYRVDEETGKVHRLLRECPDPSCGGAYMASHGDRVHCGRCGLTYIGENHPSMRCRA